jgi:hypothetical protein
VGMGHRFDVHTQLMLLEYGYEAPLAVPG